MTFQPDRMSSRSGFSRLILVLVAAATLAVSAVFMGARPASAATTLTASENPVIVPWGSTTKSITLNWKLDGVPFALLTVEENGGPVFFSQPTVSPTGSVPMTATYGKSYMAKLVDFANPASVYASLSLTT